MRSESKFSTDLNHKLERMFPGCIILKNNPNYLQGVPDKLILWKDRWAMLETKKKRPTGPNDFEPNQEWYLSVMHDMSFAACVYPENEEEILNALEYKFTTPRR